MDRPVNRRWCITRRPKGLVRATDLEFSEDSAIPRPGPGEALVRNKLLSLDPANRIWMWERETYLPPQSFGDVVRGICIATVIESNNLSLRVGMPLYGMFGWQDFAIVGANDLVVPLPEDPNVPLTLHLALFGHIGMTAYFGLLDIAKPKVGETLVVSAAAGAVGSLVGQLGKILGCRVIGIAGSDEKCEWITQELGFDAAVNYRGNEPVAEALAKHCPNGVDVYFDNVGGETLETVLDCISVGARIVLCGMISGYNDTGEEGRVAVGPRNLMQVVIKRAFMQGFLVLDYWNRSGEAIAALAQWHQAGRLKYKVHVIDDLKNMPIALNMLFDGSNRGKLIVAA